MLNTTCWRIWYPATLACWSYARIYGALYALFGLGAGFEAAFGAVYSNTGSYDQALYFSMWGFIVCSLALLLLGRYRDEQLKVHGVIAKMKPEPALKRIDALKCPRPRRGRWRCEGTPLFLRFSQIILDLYRWYVGSFYEEVFRGGIVAQRYKELLRLKLSTLPVACNQGNRRTHWQPGSLKNRLTRLITRTACSLMPRGRCSRWENSWRSPSQREH